MRPGADKGRVAVRSIDGQVLQRRAGVQSACDMGAEPGLSALLCHLDSIALISLEETGLTSTSTVFVVREVTFSSCHA